MKKILVILWIACLGACNPVLKQEAKIEGRLSNYRGDKVYFEVYGQDSLLKVNLDSAGNFSVHFPLSGPAYVRLMNGKVAFPLYLTPGMEVRLLMDAAKVKNGEYESVEFPQGINKETRMMMHYYQEQWFPSTQEMFVYPPKEFKELMGQIIHYNDSIVDHFLLADAEAYDRQFTDQFKWQIKVPLALSYFYYPVYHGLLNPGDQSGIPDDFNIFDRMLPKNDSLIYNKVYRYKTYEVSYWNDVLTSSLDSLREQPGNFFQAYADKLISLRLHGQIREDVAYTFMMQQAKAATPELKEAVLSRYREMLSQPEHLHKIEALYKAE